MFFVERKKRSFVFGSQKIWGSTVLTPCSWQQQLESTTGWTKLPDQVNHCTFERRPNALDAVLGDNRTKEFSRFPYLRSPNVPIIKWAKTCQDTEHRKKEKRKYSPRLQHIKAGKASPKTSNIGNGWLVSPKESLDAKGPPSLPLLLDVPRPNRVSPSQELPSPKNWTKRTSLLLSTVFFHYISLPIIPSAILQALEHFGSTSFSIPWRVSYNYTTPRKLQGVKPENPIRC